MCEDHAEFWAAPHATSTKAWSKRGRPESMCLTCSRAYAQSAFRTSGVLSLCSWRSMDTSTMLNRGMRQPITQALLPLHSHVPPAALRWSPMPLSWPETPQRSPLPSIARWRQRAVRHVHVRVSEVFITSLRECLIYPPTKTQAYTYLQTPRAVIRHTDACSHTCMNIYRHVYTRSVYGCICTKR